MDIKTALLLLDSLSDRIVLDSNTGKYQLGVLSRQEKQALDLLLAEVRGPHVDASDVPPVAESAPLRAQASVNLDLRSIDVKEPESPDIHLCLDFGTAVSKAFAMTTDLLPIEISLGQQAGTSGYTVDSSLFISSDGVLHFGPQALSKGVEAAETGRRRFDSPKSRLNMGMQADIDFVPIADKEINPTDISVSEGDMITLFLGYLTDLAGSQLEQRGYSRYALRRFARPCWDKGREEWAEPLMRKMLARAQILADTFHGQWQNGIRLEAAKSALDQIKKLVTLPLPLVSESGIPEPVAAAASLLCQDKGQREVFLVVDIGAGTTDFGLFLLQHNPHRNVYRVHAVPGTIQNLKSAGDLVDRLLLLFILEKAGIDGTDSKHGRHVQIDLESRIRTLKESLFLQGAIDVTLANSVKVAVQKDEFLANQKVVNFSNQLESKVHEVMESISALTPVSRDLVMSIMSDRGLNVVLTGGGAGLPMAAGIESGNLICLGKTFTRKPVQRTPEWVLTRYPQFDPVYPQLAVAIGGANPELPDSGNQLHVSS